MVVAILAFTGLAVSIMQTLVVPLLPHLPAILSTTPENGTWVLTVTLMVGAVSTPIAGRLGDMIGKRRMLMITTTMMTVGSVLCALSTTLTPMLIGRALQGMSLSSIALGISLMRDLLPKERLGSAVAMMSATLGIGGAVGLPLSALVAQQLSWHYLFVGSAVLGVIAFLAIRFLIPEASSVSGGSFDAVGAVVFSTLLVAMLFGFTKTASWGWLDWRVLGCFALALVLGVVFLRVEKRVESPMVDVGVTMRPSVRYTNLASILVGFAMYTTNLVVTQQLQAPTSTGYGFGRSMIIAGLFAAPMGFLMMGLSPLAARLIKTHGARFAFLLGIAVIGSGFLAGVFMVHAAWELIIVSMLAGAGVALSYAAAPTLIMGSVPRTQTAAANSVNTLSRSIGTSLASAVHGSILAVAFIPAGSYYGPLDPFQLCFLLGAIACVIAFAIGSRIPKQPTTSSDSGIAGRVAEQASADDRSTAYPARPNTKAHAGGVLKPSARPWAVRRRIARRPAGRSVRR